MNNSAILERETSTVDSETGAPETGASKAVAPAADPLEGFEAPRVLGRVDGSEPGPTLIVVGGLHGNEPSGVQALQRLLPELAADARAVERGRVVGLTGNRKALAMKRRFLAHDLNRYWLPERVAQLRATAAPLADEDHELRELDRQIESLVETADGPVYLLDLHTTSAPDRPFATLDDSLRNRPFAFAFPVPVVLGLEEELAGTLTAHVGDLGIITAGFESGRHGTREARDRAVDAIWIALAASGVTRNDHPEAVAARQRLEEECAGLPHVVEVRYRHAIRDEDRFRMHPGHENFQPVKRGQSLGEQSLGEQSLGEERRGSATSPVSGLLLMPLYQQQGADGFFVVKPVNRMWLEASATVRRWRLERFVHWLPGVRKHPEQTGAFIVDQRYARWLAPELFHLLGFRRQGTADRVLILRRRHDD
ncbi:MAG: succinylglutamate desuccinylase/aspartoacylase family protein [Acidobacteriota bacterium]